MDRSESWASREELEEPIATISAAVRAMRVETVQILGAALVLAGEPLAYLGNTLLYMAGATPSPLEEIRLRCWLRKTAMRDDCESLLDRLTRADAAPWPAIREALEVAWQTHLETSASPA